MENQEEEKLTPQQRIDRLEAEEDEYFDQMLAGFQANNNVNVDDDIEYFENHPMTCKELTPEMLEKPEFAALA